ncbi:hypothetical protein [Cetobacterium sp.]|uniref:hypothetical protein n=1 Tax=Cetobacterium sp. TaxID=2071632 RepID=UPI003F35507D
MNINIKIKNYLLNASDIEEISDNRLLIVSDNKNIILNDVTPELKEKYYDYFSYQFCDDNSKPKKYNKIEWTIEEIEYLKSNYSFISLKKLGKKLDKSEYQINLMLTKLNLLEKRSWTQKELNFLKQNLNKSSISLANQLKRSVASIKSKKRRLKLGIN